MAKNAASVYGSDVTCIFDADGLFSPVSGLDLVKQDAIHRLLTDSVLGPGGDDWGYDCRKLLGRPANQVPGLQPRLVEVLTRDQRIQIADVTITTASLGNGLSSVSIAVTCTTALGSFSFILDVSALSNGTITAQVR